MLSRLVELEVVLKEQPLFLNLKSFPVKPEYKKCLSNINMPEFSFAGFILALGYSY